MKQNRNKNSVSLPEAVNTSSDSSLEFKDRGTGINRIPLHSAFYYKLEALNEKIRVFMDVFYNNDRANQRTLR